MYHTIAKSIARKNFELVNQKRYDEILASCAPDIHHQFGGNHAVGGIRNDKEAMRRWFIRLGKVAPELKLKVEDVWVKGWPWNTHIFIRWTATMPDSPTFHFRFSDGTPYSNHGVHIIHMKWGKVIAIDANEDSQMVERFLRCRVEDGCEEAGMAPIVS